MNVVAFCKMENCIATVHGSSFLLKSSVISSRQRFPVFFLLSAINVLCWSVCITVFSALPSTFEMISFFAILIGIDNRFTFKLWIWKYTKNESLIFIFLSPSPFTDVRECVCVLLPISEVTVTTKLWQYDRFIEFNVFHHTQSMWLVLFSFIFLWRVGVNTKFCWPWLKEDFDTRLIWCCLR